MDRCPAMKYFSQVALVAALGLMGLAGCGRPHSAQQSAVAHKAAPLPASTAVASQMNEIAEKYWDDYLALHPLTATALGDHRFDDRFGDYASPNWMADGLAIEQETLEKLSGIDPQKLSADERVTYESLRAGREIAAEGYRYPSELLAVDPVSNLPVRFALLGTGQDVQPFRTAADYDRFLERMDGFVAWVDQSINDLRSGVAKGVVYPRPVVERTLPPLAEIGVADPKQSLFWQPILNFPAGLSVADRRRLIAAYEDKLGKQVLPAYRRLHDYLKTEYLPKARTRPGMDALPSGDYWYAYLVRYYTGSKHTPAEVHEIGLQEVARLRAETEKLMRQGSTATDLHGFFEAMRADETAYAATPAELLSGYEAVHERVRASLPLLFADLPKTALVVRATEPVRAKYADTASYRPPGIDGTEPGVLYVNTSALDTRPRCMIEAAFLREALPGRHLQAALALENPLWPRVRRVGDDFSYREGWALYAQSLGRDLGLYTDACGLAGYLMTDLWMSARVVVDTGLHAKGWTREQAIEYLRANSGLPEAAIEADVDRSLAAPGLLLAAKLGEMKILELRQRAQQQLGARFDIREFHSQVAGGGSMPLPALEAKIDRWIASHKN
jgi:uncharacterized protein (DUF885 family)